jgi:hypothetical protein
MPTHVLPPNPLLADFLAPSLASLSRQIGPRNLQLRSQLTPPRLLQQAQFRFALQKMIV